MNRDNAARFADLLENRLKLGWCADRCSRHCSSVWGTWQDHSARGCAHEVAHRLRPPCGWRSRAARCDL